MKKSSAPPSGQIRLERAKRLRPSCSSSPKLSNDTKLGHGARLFCRCDHRVLSDLIQQQQQMMMMMKWKFIYYYQLHRALDSTSSFSGSSLFPLLSFTFCSVQFTISTFSAPSALPSLRVRQTQTAQLGRDIQRVNF